MKKPHYSAAGKSASKGRKEAATELAIAALGFLAGEHERLERFLALTGDETLLLAFADESGIDPEAIARARDALADRPGHTGAA
jgi:hypothetical protein